MTDRRAFVGGLAAGVLAVTRGARAQSTRKVYRIGILGMGAASDLAGPQPRSPTTLAFLRRMRELGYVYGEHFVTEVRGADGKLERFPGLAAELVGLQLDVIVAPGPALPALKKATSTIPIVMAASSDPVGSGYVQSLSRPGGNITGLSLQSVETMGKRLELLKELVPGASPVAVLWDRGNFTFWPAAEAAARGRGWKLLSFEVRDVGQIEGALPGWTQPSPTAGWTDAESAGPPHLVSGMRHRSLPPRALTHARIVQAPTSPVVVDTMTWPRPDDARALQPADGLTLGPE